MREKFGQFRSTVRDGMAVYRRVARHPRTPPVAGLLLGAAVGYLLLPVDVIPDAIPVLGQIDDLLVVPGLVFLALQMIPEDVVASSQRQVREENAQDGGPPL